MCYRCLTVDSGRNRSAWRQGAAAVTAGNAQSACQRELEHAVSRMSGGLQVAWRTLSLS